MHKTETSANPYQKQYGLADVWFIRLNLLACHAHIPVTDSAQSPHPAQVGQGDNGKIFKKVADRAGKISCSPFC
jgi:hypothetical protein